MVDLSSREIWTCVAGQRCFFFQTQTDAGQGCANNDLNALREGSKMMKKAKHPKSMLGVGWYRSQYIAEQARLKDQGS
jgi:hypothetical protein